jgi:RsiW-degrading membrane proteinase PrsW (M82 family)
MKIIQLTPKFKLFSIQLIIVPDHPDFNEKLFFLISGIIISVPFTIFFEMFANSVTLGSMSFYAALWSTVLVAPIVEEFAKIYPLFYRHGENERSLYTIGFMVGLGFGIAEFLIYVLVYGSPLPIRLIGILFHAATTSIIAYGIAKKKTWRYFTLAVFLHMSNNLFALFGDLWLLGGVLAIITAYAFSLHFYFETKGR